MIEVTMASNSPKKVTIVDLLQQFLKQGVKPPQALLNAAAESEAIKPQGTSLERMSQGSADPIGLGVGAYKFGPMAQLAGEASGPILNRLPLSELLGPMGKVPKLVEMAQKAVSGSAKGIPTGPQNPFNVPTGEPTEELKGVKLPGGAVAAKGTSPIGVPIQMSTGHLNETDKWDMALGGPNEPDTTETDKEQLFDLLLGNKGNVTGPLPPQGAVTEKFGQWSNQEIPNSSNPPFTQPKPVGVPTEKLTPFDAWQNMQMNQPFTGAETKELPGWAHDVPLGTKHMGSPAINTQPLQPDNRTMSLEPADIDEMAGRETPATGDLLSALAKNLSPKDTLPLPENTLYHGMNVFGHRTPKDALAKIAEQGMKGGWFSEEPHQAFGPHFIATTPEDLPPLLIRSKQFNVDPEKEIIPRWKKMNTENLHTQMQMRGKSPRAELTPDTVKGRPAVRSNWPNIHQLVGADEGGGGFPLEKGGHVVDPSKLFLANNKGDITGRMAPKGGKPNAIGQLWDRVKAFRNVLEEGTRK